MDLGCVAKRLIGRDDESSPRTLQIAADKGREWFEYQLGQGFDLAQSVLARNFLAEGSFETFVSADTPSEEVEFPRYPDVQGGEIALAARLEQLAKQGARSVVIEDDVQRNGDPHVESPSAFLGDRVLHWREFRTGEGKAAAHAIREGAFGYPLNAFVLSKSLERLGLRDHEQAPSDLSRHVTSSLMAVIVSAFDNTSFAMWTRDLGSNPKQS